MKVELTGKRAIVTGGSNGIGAACVSALQEAGAEVTSLDIVQPTESAPDIAIVGDIRDAHCRAESISAARQPQILVNNAAIQFEERLDETSSEDILRLLQINVIAAMEMTREFGQEATDGGSIVNIASALGVTGDPGLAAYTVSKGAMVNFTRTAALEYAGSLRVNAVLPGAVRTPLTTRVWDASDDPALLQRQMESVYPLGRIAEPREIGSVVAFLSSPLASFMTGALVPVDGGLLAANAEWALGRLAE